MKLFALPALALVLLAACDLNVPENDRNYAYVSVPVTEDEVIGGLRISPTAVFFRTAFGSLIADSRTTQEGCIIEEFNPSPGQPFDHINGGDSVIVSATAGNAVMKPVTLPQRIEYRIAAMQPLSTQPTDTLLITTVGSSGGFPPMTHRIAMVSPVQVDPVTIPPTGTPMTVTWSGASDDEGVKLEISFQYMQGGNNMRLLCVLHDDGNAQIPAFQLTGLQAAANPPSTGNVLRYRSSNSQSGPNTLVAVVFHESTVLVDSP